jgi:hypothetical protein
VLKSGNGVLELELEIGNLKLGNGGGGWKLDVAI